METLKEIYRQVAKRIHPDLTTNETERLRRNDLMSEANQAYREGNEKKLREMLDNGKGVITDLPRVRLVAGEIAFCDMIIVREKLPYPVVYYPGRYGTFFGFAKDESSSVVLCDCAETAVKNLLALRDSVIKLAEFPYRVHFPENLAEYFIKSWNYQPTFIPGLCHKCQGKKAVNHYDYLGCSPSRVVAPTLKYCHQMYGSKFVQQYGWYVQQTYLRLGIYPQSTFNWGFAFLPNVCSVEYQQEILAVKRGLKNVKDFTTKIETLTRQEFWSEKRGFQYHHQYC